MNAVGQLMWSDLIILGLLPWIFVCRSTWYKDRLPMQFVGFGLLYLVGQVLTDLLRLTPFEDFSRRWSMIGLLLAYMVVLWPLLAGNAKRIVLFASGLIAATLYGNLTGQSEFLAEDSWKFGVGTSLVQILLLLNAAPGLRRSSLWPIIAGVALGVVSFFQGSRSLGLFCLVAAGYIAIRRGLLASKRAPSGWSILACVFVLIVGALGVGSVYGETARRGILGAKMKTKFLEQEKAGGGSVLLGGRNESRVSLAAIAESPILGHGSWAKDMRYVYMTEQLSRQQGGKGKYVNMRRSGLIPTHSFMLGAWVEAGLLGAVFWAFCLVFVVRALWFGFRSGSPLAPLAIFIGIGLIWDILFSPFGLDRRMTVPFHIILLTVLMPGGTFPQNRASAAIVPNRPDDA